jgi:cyclopropane fatty-acyl-phospholipid synthase-like methyltransferase
MYLDTEPDPDVAARHVGRYERAINLAGRTGGTWVDFACGSGYGTAIIAQGCDTVIGIDASKEAIDHARREYPHLLFLRGSVLGLKRAMHLWGPVDVVVSIETLEHLLPDEQRDLVRAVRNQLAPGGVFVLACPIGDGPNPDNVWHVHEPTLTELNELLSVFSAFSLETEEYMSTSGPAVQAWAVARA